MGRVAPCVNVASEPWTEPLPAPRCWFHSNFEIRGPETTPVCFPDGGQLAGVLARAGKCVLPASGSEINGIECVCVNDMPSWNGCSINPSFLLFGFP